MSTGHPGFAGAPALVPGELRGYRRFRLGADGLYPTVHSAGGPWSGQLERAVCHAPERPADDGTGAAGVAAGSPTASAALRHSAPAADCGCGLYAWYTPADADESSGFGDVHGVVAARGRTVLGDHGFRAAGARIEAVALPARLRLRPRAAARTAAMLAEAYPHTRVYASRRQMLRDHPAADVRVLNPRARPNPARRYRQMAMAVWAVGVLALYGLVVLPDGEALDAGPALWLPALGVFVLWQATLVWLAARYFSPPRPPGDSTG